MRQLLVERFALEQLGHEERLAFVGPDIVDGKNVGMVQRGNRTGLHTRT